MKRTLALLLVSSMSFGAACAEPSAPTPAAPVASSTASSPVPAAAPSSPASSAPAIVDAAAPDAATNAASTPPPPAPVKRTGKVWPFHSWTRAEAFTFNEFGLRPGVPLVVVNESGWSRHIGSRKAITPAQAKKAVDLVIETEGSVDVSKCAFPRHAVVLYDGEAPIASINVCFECGDIRVWPPYTNETIPVELDARAQAALEKRWLRQEKLYARAFPKWKTFFRDDVGFDIDKSYRPGAD